MGPWELDTVDSNAVELTTDGYRGKWSAIGSASLSGSAYQTSTAPSGYVTPHGTPPVLPSQLTVYLAVDQMGTAMSLVE